MGLYFLIKGLHFLIRRGFSASKGIREGEIMEGKRCHKLTHLYISIHLISSGNFWDVSSIYGFKCKMAAWKLTQGIFIRREGTESFTKEKKPTYDEVVRLLCSKHNAVFMASRCWEGVSHEKNKSKGTNSKLRRLFRRFDYQT